MIQELEKMKVELKGWSEVHWTSTRNVSYTDSQGKLQTRTETDHHRSFYKMFCWG
jgi:hypothetical protein